MLAGHAENGLRCMGGRTAPELKEKLTKTKMKGNPLDTFKKFYADTASFWLCFAIRCGLISLEKTTCYLPLICHLIRKRDRVILTGL